MRVVVILAALAVSGCSTPCVDAITQAQTHSFTCADGSNLIVTFNPQPSFVHVVQQGFAPLDLPSEVTGSGYRYAEAGAELNGRMGGETHWTRPGDAETVCRETVTTVSQ